MKKMWQFVNTKLEKGKKSEIKIILINGRRIENKIKANYFIEYFSEIGVQTIQ